MFDKNNRLIYLAEDVDNASIGEICYNLLLLIEEDNKKDEKEKDYKRDPIKIYIHSYGGSVYDMWALIDIIESSKTPIYTYCTGYAMSAAFKIFIAGHKRFIGKRATLMYHQMSTGMFGKVQDLIERQEENEKIQSNIEEYVISKTNLSKKDLKKIREKKKDVFFNSEDAIKLGMADEII